ncbi:MAG: inositol monophosphatase [Deltaproteobacteria bacterium]|nr:inositol monophosphatase [Deltaproteobacteria bacterium]MDQ3299258.1 inositol monophosphatase [Myxococcota bacterium]
MSEPAVAELLAAAQAAARAASHLLKTARPHQIRSKSNPRDLVTEWDVRSEELIRRVLGERVPGVPVVGEEGGGSAAHDVVSWLVDPIDGTVNFAHGLPIWSVSIAAVRGTELLAGVVVAPALGWWFEATLGGGARDGSGAPLAVSAIERLEDALLVTGFPYDLATNPDNNLGAWLHLLRTAGSVRRLGSAAIDLCLVASGQLDGYWEPRLQAWDLAAGALIAREAGATVTNMAGGPFDPYTGEVAATNGAIHEGLIVELARASQSAS